MLFLPISLKSQVVAVTHSGFSPTSKIFRTCAVLSLPPETGMMQSHFESDFDLNFEIINSNSFFLASQSTSTLFKYALHAEQTPKSSNRRSGLVDGSKQIVQYLIILNLPYIFGLKISYEHSAYFPIFIPNSFSARSQSSGVSMSTTVSLGNSRIVDLVEKIGSSSSQEDFLPQ